MTAFSVKVQQICDGLYNSLDLERVRATGSISPRSSLRFVSAKKAFSWAGEIHEHRYFTRTAVRAAPERPVSHYELQLPRGGGSCDLQEWLKFQTKAVHRLLRRAVKNSSARANKTAMDDAETQPYDVWEDRAQFIREP